MKTNITLGCIVLVTSLFVACGGDNIKITPDTSSASTGTGSSSSGTGGFGGQPPGAGGGSPCDSCGNKDGQRIAAQFTTSTTDDGLVRESFLGIFYDKQLKVSCTPRVAEDDALRCLPLVYQDAAGNTPALILSQQQADAPIYYDSVCTQRMVEGQLPACGSSPKYVLEPFKQLSCKDTAYRVFKLGMHVSSPVAYIKTLSGQCVMKAVVTGEYYFVVAQSQPNDFAIMTVTIAP